MFGIEVTANAYTDPDTGQAVTPRIYGNGKMAAYNTLVAAANGTPQNQQFYLAQIGAENAGKTMEIRLFDPGDVGGDAVLHIIQPDGTPATFTYASDANWVANSDAQSNPVGTDHITTAVRGRSSFNNTWITIDIPLSINYGKPSLPNGGWWQIRYTVGNGNDTTTWEVSIKGNPVHLIVPG